MKKSKAMKTFKSLFLLMLILTSAIVFAQNDSSVRANIPDELKDVAQNTKPGPVQYAVDEYPLLFEYPCGNTTGEAGVETDGNFIYTSLWNGTEFCKYAPDGSYLGTFSIPGVAAVRDMAYDGTYFYGSAASTLIFEMDFTTLSLISTFIAPTATRAIAYDDLEDGFYGNNWSTPIVLYDRTGATINTIPTAGDESYYGFAFDPWQNYLWGYSQKDGTSLNMLYKMELPDGMIIESFDMLTVLTLPTPGTDIAGGLFFNYDLVSGSCTLGGIVQNVCIWGINTCYYPPPPQYDVGVLAFISPTTEPYLGMEIVTIRVKNFSVGSQIISNIPVYYKLDGGTPVTGIVPSPISPGESQDFTFQGTVNLSTPGQTYEFVGCTTLEGDDNPDNNCKTVSITNILPVYCDASTSTEDEYIANVLCGAINNSSYWQAGVADYTALHAYGYSGALVNITVTNGSPYFGDKATVWVDWDQDFIFDMGTNEEFILTDIEGTGATFTGLISVPLGQVGGDFRMRIRLTYSTAPNPCGNADYGEIEDYTIFIGGSPGPPPPSNLQATLNGNDVYLTWDSPEGVKLIESRALIGYYVFRNDDFIGFSDTTNYSDNNLEPGTYSYSVIALYEEGQSMPAGPVTIIVPPEAEISVNPESIIQNVPIGGTTQTILDISNTGGQELTYNIVVTYPTVARIQPEPYDAIEAANRLAERMAADGISADLVSLAFDKPAGILPDQKNNEIIRYDDGKNSSAIGLTTGGTFGISAYYPAATFTRYEGWSLSQLGFYINQVPEICKIKIYGEGTSTSPGALRYEEIVYPTGSSWNIFTLSEAVVITGEDLWLGLELTHQAGTNPAGCDDGPALAGFGDMVSFNNTTWAPLSNCGLNYNWNLAGYLVKTNPDETNDVGVQTYLSPHNKTNLGDEVVKIRIKNYGTAPQSNIPVFYTVDGGAAVADTVPGPITYGETIDFTFQQTVNLGNPGQTYVFQSCTALLGDENTTNDCYPFEVTNLLPEYCPAYTSEEDEYIANVLMDSINNSSGWQNGVADYTTISTTTQAGTSQEIKVTNGHPWAADIVYTWVDWNLDNEFDVNNEAYFLTNVGGTGAIFNGLITVPEGQLNGDYRLRIRMTYSIPPHPCCSAQYGEIEDYTIKVAGGQPNWLTVPSPAGAVFPGATANVPLHFNTAGLGLGSYAANLKITNSSGNAPVLDVPVTMIVTDTSASLIVEPTLLEETHNPFPKITTRQLTVTNNGTSTIDFDVVVNNEVSYLPNPPVIDPEAEARPEVRMDNLEMFYCDASTTTEDEYIANVLFGTIDNSSGWQGGVADYIAISTTIEAGASENMTVTNGNPYASDYCYAWVDWNRDYTFGVATDEEFILTNIGGTGASFTGAVTVPAGTPEGDYRMRIRMTYSITPEPCGNASYGEIEDYTVHVGQEQPTAWLSAEPLSGSLNPGDSMIVNVTFNSEGLVAGEYAGSVVFNSNDPVNPVINVPVSLIAGGCGLPAPTNLLGVPIQSNHVHLTWESPQTPGGIIRWDDGINNDGIGLTAGGTFSVAARWTGAQLVYYDGLSLTGIDFFPRSTMATVFTLKVWKGANASTLMLSQPLSGLTQNAWNTVLLSTPVIISSATELWIGYECSAQPTGDYPAGCDEGPAVAGYGDMISTDGTTWATLSGYGLSYNWNLAGTISADELGKPLAQPIVIGKSYSGTGTTLSQGNLPAALNAVWTGSNRDLLGYNVYRDEVKVNSTIVTNLYYDDYVPSPWLSLWYYVTAVYPECESAPDSIYVMLWPGITENGKTSTVVFPNPATHWVTIESELNISQITIINNIGREVYNSFVGEKSIQVNTAGFNKGIYIIRIETEKGIISEKLVIQ